MNRRGFIQISSVVAIPILLGIFPRNKKEKKNYEITVRSNRAFGHLLREHATTLPTKTTETDYIIVGGGIAGVAAATVLKNEKFILFEGDDRLGGSSAAADWKSTRFATGAHYELAYPTHFGKEVIELLTALNIIEFNIESNLYTFTDKQYVIKSSEMEQCFQAQEVLEDVLSDAIGIDEFYELLEAFETKMHLPTRLITSDYHYLNTISFKEFLTSKMQLSADLEQRISYQMLDDWGGKCDEVSALAGIHYYTCRPYNTQEVELFSPPNGNAYFIEKMVGQLPDPEALQTDTLVRTIRETTEGIEAEILRRNGTVELVKAKGLIYAGQKHALPHILAGSATLFSNSYAPWLVVNIICDKGIDFSKWQNDILTSDLQFLGFVNSQKQKTKSTEYDVFTAYYCLSENERTALVSIEENPTDFIQATIALIEQETASSIENFVRHVNLNVLGHAMPIPKPNYLTFSNVPQFSERIIFAGVDTGRLPLFYEACDSGLQAANQVLNNLSKIKNSESGTL